MQELMTFLLQHSALSSSFFGIILLLIMIEWIRAKHRAFCITPLQVIQAINHQQAIIIDLRSSESYQTGHIIHALSIPVKQLSTQRMQRFAKLRMRPLIFVCAIGVEAQKIAALFLKKGYEAYALAGGMRAWLTAAMPVSLLINHPLHPLEKKDLHDHPS